MSTTITAKQPVWLPKHPMAGGGILRYAVPVGRALFGAIFILAAWNHLSEPAIDYAASQGVPLPWLLVPISGLIALAGGLSVLLGYHARQGAGLLVLFLVPVTLALHQFWGVQDPASAQMQQSMFMKNLSMLGGALLIAYFGAGPLSLDARRASQSERGREPA
ncbi:MAG TPA: DoxX family protein [Gemmatimonadales bacterium]|nr:DoxX family protein [Gemmatimonadales bacterium]